MSIFQSVDDLKMWAFVEGGAMNAVVEIIQFRRYKSRKMAEIHINVIWPAHFAQRTIVLGNKWRLYSYE